MKIQSPRHRWSQAYCSVVGIPELRLVHAAYCALTGVFRTLPIVALKYHIWGAL